MSDNRLIDTIPGESDNLALHVQLCEQRYLQLLNKFDQVDEKFDRIESILVEIRASIGGSQVAAYQKYLAGAGVAVTALTGLVAHLLTR
jgi:hypothetical protein